MGAQIQNGQNGQSKQTGTIAVIGIGNILLKDDGVGVHVINALKETVLPPAVLLVDGGTSTLDMLDYFMEHGSLVIIDALRGGSKPGTLYKLTPLDMAGLATRKSSLHDVQILEVIEMAHLLGFFPEITIYGIEPEEITYGLEMSKALMDALPGIVDTIFHELRQRVL